MFLIFQLWFLYCISTAGKHKNYKIQTRSTKKNRHYLARYWLDKGFKGTVVTLEISLTVSLIFAYLRKHSWLNKISKISNSLPTFKQVKIITRSRPPPTTTFLLNRSNHFISYQISSNQTKSSWNCQIYGKRTAKPAWIVFLPATSLAPCSFPWFMNPRIRSNCTLFTWTIEARLSNRWLIK